MTRINDLTLPVYWRGRQWAVTAYGIETIGDPYHYYMPKERLGYRPKNSDGKDEGVFEAFRHIAEKTWVDLEDLREAFRQARVHHKRHFPKWPSDFEFDATIKSERRQRK